MGIKINNDCSEKIKQAMKEKKLKIKDISDKLGLSRDTVGRVINGKQEMSRKLLNELCTLLSPEAHQIFAYYGYPIDYKEEMENWNKQQSRFLIIIKLLTDVWNFRIQEIVTYDDVRFSHDYARDKSWICEEKGDLKRIMVSETIYEEAIGELYEYDYDAVVKKVRGALSQGKDVLHTIELILPDESKREMSYYGWLKYLQTLVNDLYRSAIFDTLAVDIENIESDNIERAINIAVSEKRKKQC